MSTLPDTPLTMKRGINKTKYAKMILYLMVRMTDQKATRGEVGIGLAFVAVRESPVIEQGDSAAAFFQCEAALSQTTRTSVGSMHGSNSSHAC